MKKIVNWLCAAVMVLSAATPAAAQKDWPGFGRYAEKNAALAPGSVKVVLIGDSITELWASSHNEFFTSRGYLGRGISGQVSTQMLARFSQDVIALGPEVVVINAGTNDIAENQGTYNQERTLEAIVAMVRLAQANGIKPVLSSVLPASGFRWRPEIKDAQEKITALNARIREFAEANKLLYVDYYSALLSPDRTGLDIRYSKDGVHPVIDGYLLMEPLVTEAVDKALSSRKYGKLKVPRR